MFDGKWAVGIVTTFVVSSVLGLYSGLQGKADRSQFDGLQERVSDLRVELARVGDFAREAKEVLEKHTFRIDRLEALQRTGNWRNSGAAVRDYGTLR